MLTPWYFTFLENFLEIFLIDFFREKWMALYLASALVFVRSLGDRGQVQTQKQTIRQTDRQTKQTDRQTKPTHRH